MSEEKKTIYPTLEENVAHMNAILPIKESFDLIQRDIIIGEKKCTFYFIDGFTKDEVMQKLMSSFFAIKKDDMPSTATGFSKMCLSYVEVDVIADFDLIVKNQRCHKRIWQNANYLFGVQYL